MKSLIVISCILASGAHIEPRGQYKSWQHCGHWVERFETEIYPRGRRGAPLCWCHKVPSLPLPDRPIRYDETRKAPLP